MSAFAQKVKRYYALGLWKEQQVRDAAVKNLITAEEFKAITGKDISAE